MKIEVSQLNCRYAHSQVNALSNINHVFEAGSYWCVAGANGSGKSTLLKAICRLLEGIDMTGSILLNGERLEYFERAKLASFFGYVPGGTVIQFPITVFELVAQGRFPFLHGVSAALSESDKKTITTVMNILGLEKFQNRLVSQLSWGEAALALLGRALAQQPNWLILDEAISSLDMGVQRRVFTALERINKEQRVGILFVGHDLNLVAEFIPNVLWLHEGSVIESGKFSDVLSDELLRRVYGDAAALSVAPNPKTGKPKVFFS